MAAWMDLFGKRFIGYLTSVTTGMVAAKLIVDGVNLQHFYTFIETLFGIYVAGQSATDGIAFLKGVKTIVRG